jgi:hypothetical protein
LNHQNIASAIEHGVWATQKQNEDKLNEAYYSAEAVYLVFSVNMSHHFQVIIIINMLMLVQENSLSHLRVLLVLTDRGILVQSN